MESKARHNLEASIFHTPEATVSHYSFLFSQLRGADVEGTVVIDLSDGGVGERPLIGQSLLFQMEDAA